MGGSAGVCHAGRSSGEAAVDGFLAPGDGPLENDTSASSPETLVAVVAV